MEQTKFDRITLEVRARRGNGFVDRSGYMDDHLVVIKGKANSQGYIYSYTVYIDGELYQTDYATYQHAEHGAWLAVGEYQ